MVTLRMLTHDEDEMLELVICHYVVNDRNHDLAVTDCDES